MELPGINNDLDTIDPLVFKHNWYAKYDFNTLKDRYEIVVQNYATAWTNRNVYRKSITDVQQKLREANQRGLLWKQKAEQREGQLLTLRKLLAEIQSVSSNTSQIPSNPDEVSIHVNKKVLEEQFEGTTFAKRAEGKQTAVPPSSQTTVIPEEEHEHQVEKQVIALGDPIEDDEPVVVKAHCLKRKRKSAPDRMINNQENGAINYYSSKPIKIEAPNSPEMRPKAPMPSSEENTIDLDEVGGSLRTPRKRTLAVVDFTDGQTNITAGSFQAFAPNEQAEFENAIHSKYGETFKNLSLTEMIQSSPPAQQDESTRDVLQGISTNVRASPNVDIPKNREAENIAAETLSTNDAKLCTEFQTTGKPQMPRQNTKARKKLTNLLEPYFVEKDVLQPQQQTPLTIKPGQNMDEPKSRMSDVDTRTSQYEHRHPNSNFMSKRRSKRLSEIDKVARTSTSKPQTSSIRKLGSGLLRNKPVEQLKLSDFKVNPRSNHGQNHAYAEVARGRDARKCLPGCTKMDCCGAAFQKAVEIAGIPKSAATKPSLWDQTQNSEIEDLSVTEENSLLSWYLGEGADLTALPAAERQEALLKARTKKLANMCGRHRYSYERAPSPAGFWRTDMPSTQEIEKDRENARKAEGEKIKERYREAMRSDGKWLFRDEEPT